MATLSIVSAAVLRDLAAAQDASNRFTRNLCIEYQHDELLKLFSVPNARVSAAEIDLRVAFHDPVVDPVNIAQNLVTAEQTFEAHAPALAATAGGCIVDGVQALLGGDPSQSELLSTLTTGLQSAYYREHLEDRIFRALFDARETILDRSNNLDVGGASATIVATVDDELQRHPDLAPLFAANAPARSSVGASLAAAIPAELAQIAAELHDTGSLHDDYTAEVIVDAAQLAALPPEVISTLTIRLDVQRFTWTVDDGQQRLLPQ
jgi:hypothetical protein